MLYLTYPLNPLGGNTYTKISSLMVLIKGQWNINIRSCYIIYSMLRMRLLKGIAFFLELSKYLVIPTFVLFEDDPNEVIQGEDDDDGDFEEVQNKKIPILLREPGKLFRIIHPLRFKDTQHSGVAFPLGDGRGLCQATPTEPCEYPDCGC